MKQNHRHQHETGRPFLNQRQQLLHATAAPAVGGLIRALKSSWRFSTSASAGLDLDTREPLIFCCWHRDLAAVAAYLLTQTQLSQRAGFLVSPSRDGEFVARILAGFEADFIRGSANRTGAQALRALYQTLTAGISPLIPPDGPKGPALEAKPGTIKLAQMTGYPLLPIHIETNRYWQFRSWDRLVLPKPFARIEVTLGKPLTVHARDDIDVKADELGSRLNGDPEADEATAAEAAAKP